jgi:hypothetical protein
VLLEIWCWGLQSRVHKTCCAHAQKEKNVSSTTESRPTAM